MAASTCIKCVLLLSVTVCFIMTSPAYADKAAIVTSKECFVAQNVIKGNGTGRLVGFIKQGAAINVEKTGYNWLELTSAPIRRGPTGGFIDWHKTCAGKNKCYVDSKDIKMD